MGEQHDSHISQCPLWQRLGQCSDGDPGRVVVRIPVDAAGDRGEGETPEAELGGQADPIAIAGCERLGLALPTTAPDRADGVQDPRRRQVMSTGGIDRTGPAPLGVEGLQVGKEPRSSRGVDGSVHASTPP